MVRITEMITDRPTPMTEQFEDAAERIESLRLDLVCEIDHTAIPPQAEEHLMLALCALEQARRHMKLASILTVRGQ